MFIIVSYVSGEKWNEKSEMLYGPYNKESCIFPGSKNPDVTYPYYIE